MQNNKLKWHRLENASKIFPAIANEKDPKVFRLTCELKEQVNPEYLQQACDNTLELFPIYSSVLKRGMFWYFFEEKNFNYKVEEESETVHAPLYLDNKSPLFRVIYYKRRIILEVFHALTDGIGASWFLRTLVAQYLNIMHDGRFSEEVEIAELGASLDEKMADSFTENYVKDNNAKTAIPTPRDIYILKGTRTKEYRTKVIEATMSVSDTLAVSRSYGTSLTIYLTAVLIHAIHSVMDVKNSTRPINIHIPVNLRNLFYSKTSRNFFANMEIPFTFKTGNETLEDTIAYLNDAFVENLKEENAQLLLDKYVSLERNPIVRVLPLVLKDLVLKVAGRVNYGTLSSLISNLGQIKMSDSFTPYIEKFTFSASSSTPQISACSFEDKLVVTFSSPFIETDVQKAFYRTLTDAGIEITLTANI